MASAPPNRPTPPSISTSPVDPPAAGSDTAAPSAPPAGSQPPMDPRQKQRLSRPTLGSRKSSGTLIIPRDSPTVEVKDEQYDEGDARAMSPRRSSEEIDKMGVDAKAALAKQAETLQGHLKEILNRVDSVKVEHDKIEGGNKFLQSYIGELMSTSKITAAGAGKSKKGRTTK